jgi:hypothetical protein
MALKKWLTSWGVWLRSWQAPLRVEVVTKQR